MLQELNKAHADLKFNDIDHSYYVGNNQLIPVTSLIKNFYQEFDRSIAKSIAKKRGITEEQLLAEWDKTRDDAISYGHATHSFGEEYGKSFFDDQKPIPKTPEQQAIVKFFKELPPKYLPVGFEQRMYSRKYNYAGTADLILFDGKKGFVIVDYKTGKDLYKNYNGQMMLFPFNYMLDTPFNHYQLQLSLYQIMMEECNYLITERWVIWLKPNGNYEKKLTNNFVPILKKHLAA